MPRPKCCRTVGSLPASEYFKPRGIPLTDIEEIILSVDELEALHLADYEQLYQEQAARRMNVSRQTFGRILDTARQKTADALIHSKALKIEGGEYILRQKRRCPRKNRHENDCRYNGRPSC